MQLNTAFLRSKLGRRIFLAFVCCSLLPIIALSLLSFNHVTNQLKDQGLRRIQQETRAYGMAIFDRLLFCQADLQLIAQHVLTTGIEKVHANAVEIFGERLGERFDGVYLVRQNNEFPVLGRIDNLPTPSAQDIEAISHGTTTIMPLPQTDSPAWIFMGVPVDAEDPSAGYLMGEINQATLWGIGYAGRLPPGTELCVLDQVKKVLTSSFPVSVDFLKEVAFKTEGTDSRCFEYIADNESYLGSYWPVFLNSMFFSDNWIVVLRRAKADVLAPMADFKKIFPLVVLLSLWIVLLLSVISIRRNLVPLEKLQEGTRRIAMRDFDSRVVVTSGDEFQDLAASFNDMSAQLCRQFNTLATIAEIDTAILSSLNIEKTIVTALNRMHSFFACEKVAVGIINKRQSDKLTLYVHNVSSDEGVEQIFPTIYSEEINKLNENASHLLITPGDEAPDYLASFSSKGIRLFLILPVFLDTPRKLAGFIVLGYMESKVFSDEEFSNARQIANQFAVALANSNLIDELENLNWGTIEALARTVDAKSSWTAGHSERVTELAVEIGKRMGLSQKEIATLNRAALLHDIGKIGVPLRIIDKPGKLDDDEYEQVKDHSRIGARILEPISAYEDVVPIVRQHHERYDGKGYPDGLAGEAINIYARILSVADVYDALISVRPYRQGWVEDSVVELIKQESGHQFDPKVVDAFLATLG